MNKSLHDILRDHVYGIDDLVYIRPSCLERNPEIYNYVHSPLTRVYSIVDINRENGTYFLRVHCEEYPEVSIYLFCVSKYDIAPDRVEVSRQTALSFIEACISDTNLSILIEDLNDFLSKETLEELDLIELPTLDIVKPGTKEEGEVIYLK